MIMGPKKYMLCLTLVGLLAVVAAVEETVLPPLTVDVNYKHQSWKDVAEGSPVEADKSHVTLPAEECPGKQEPPLETDQYTQCVPLAGRCRRNVVDNAVLKAPEEGVSIVAMMNRILEHYGNGGGDGAVSLVDLNGGVVSRGEQFVSLLKSMQNNLMSMKKEYEALGENALHMKESIPFTKAELQAYVDVITRIHREVSKFVFCDPYPCQTRRKEELAMQEGIEKLFVAKPSFFSRITGNKTRPAKTVNDEYWHEHVDRDQYGSFAVTTLLYLSSHDPAMAEEKPDLPTGVTNENGEWPLPEDAKFTGGRFIFGKHSNMTVDPKLGRLSMFTSNSENPHWVEQVGSGTRYTLTTAFTCNKDEGFSIFTAADAAKDPKFLPKKRFVQDIKKLQGFAGHYFKVKPEAETTNEGEL